MVGKIQRHGTRAVGGVSQPGFGTSAGPADLAGPATLAALEAALAELKRMPGIDPKRVFVLGHSQGGRFVTVMPRLRQEDAHPVRLAFPDARGSLDIRQEKRHGIRGGSWPRR